MTLAQKVQSAIDPDGDFDDAEDLKKTIEVLRSRVLYGALAEGTDPEYEQWLLLAVSSLEQAERFAMLAEYSSRRDLARTQRSRP